jgi:tetratricopeptide (TPR) repeat protein
MAAVHLLRSSFLLAVMVAGGAAEDPSSLASQAVSAAERGDAGQAERLWRAALERDPAYFPANFNFGVFLHRAGRHEEAVRFLEWAAKLQPDHRVHFLRGLNFQRLGRREDTIRAWRAALALQPDNVKLLQVLCVEYTQGRYFREAAVLAGEGANRFPNVEALYYIAIKGKRLVKGVALRPKPW